MFNDISRNVSFLCRLNTEKKKKCLYAGYCWEIKVEHLERVKWYAPHIRHVVADVRCRQMQR